MSYRNRNYGGSKYPYRRSPEPKEVLRIEISDCIGNPLEPGMIVAYAAGSKLKFGVYEGVTKIGIGSNTRYRIQLCTAKGMKVRRSVLGSLTYDKKEDEFSIPENLVVVKNPLYHLGSDAVAACLQAIDVLKDEGHLPDDYKAR